MSKFCLRPLTTINLVQQFAKDVLEIKERNLLSKACTKIISAEFEWLRFSNHCTLTSDDFRDPQYSSAESREELREIIIRELLTQKRLPNDDDIELGKGGILPITGDIREEKKAYYIIGLPASGKSSIAGRIADFSHSAILDNDYAKRKLPEYDSYNCGATLVHEESDYIVFQNKQYSAIEYCVANGYNIIVAKIGATVEGVKTLTESLKEAGYKVSLILIDLDRKVATQRAFDRFMKSGRYVPLTMIFDGYGNDPIITYYRLKQKYHDIFDGFMQISTSGERPYIVESENMNDIKKLIEEEQS